MEHQWTAPPTFYDMPKKGRRTSTTCTRESLRSEKLAHRTPAVTPARPPAPGSELLARLKRESCASRTNASRSSLPPKQAAITFDVEVLTKCTALAIAQRAFPELYKTDCEDPPAELKQEHAAVLSALQAAFWHFVVSVFLFPLWFLEPRDLTPHSGLGSLVVAARVLECGLVLAVAFKKPFLYRTYSKHLSVLLIITDAFLSGSFLSAVLNTHWKAMSGLLAAFLLLPVAVRGGPGSTKPLTFQAGTWGGLRHQFVISTTYMILIAGFLRVRSNPVLRASQLFGEVPIATSTLLAMGVPAVALINVVQPPWVKLRKFANSCTPSKLAWAVASAGKDVSPFDKELYTVLRTHFLVSFVMLGLATMAALVFTLRLAAATQSTSDVVLFTFYLTVRVAFASFFVITPRFRPAWYLEHLWIAPPLMQWLDSILAATFVPVVMSVDTGMTWGMCITIPVLKSLVHVMRNPWHWIFVVGLFACSLVGTVLAFGVFHVMPEIHYKLAEEDGALWWNRCKYLTTSWLGQCVALVVGFVMNKEEVRNPVLLRAASLNLNLLREGRCSWAAFAGSLVSLVAPEQPAACEDWPARTRSSWGAEEAEQPAACEDWPARTRSSWGAEEAEAETKTETKQKKKQAPAQAQGEQKAWRKKAQAGVEAGPNWLCEQACIPVFDRLDAHDLLVVEAVCRDWRRIVEDYNVWRQLCIQMYGKQQVMCIQSMMPFKRISWKQLYWRSCRATGAPSKREVPPVHASELLLVVDLFVGAELAFTTSRPLGACLHSTAGDDEFEAAWQGLHATNRGALDRAVTFPPRPAPRRAGPPPAEEEPGAAQPAVGAAAAALDRTATFPPSRAREPPEEGDPPEGEAAEEEQGAAEPIVDMAGAPLRGMVLLVRACDGAMVMLVGSTAFMGAMDHPWHSLAEPALAMEPVGLDHPLPDLCRQLLARRAAAPPDEGPGRAAPPPPGRMWSVQFGNPVRWQARNGLSDSELQLCQMLDCRMTVFFAEQPPQEDGGARRVEPKLLSLTVSARNENQTAITCDDMFQWYLPHAFKGQEGKRSIGRKNRTKGN